jgi:hypothetical protein
MSVSAWFEGNDMIVELPPLDANGVAVESATVTLTMQQLDKTEVEAVTLVWPLAMPEVSAGVYRVIIDRLELDVAIGQLIRAVVDLDDGAGTQQQWIKVLRVQERAPT